MRRLWGGKKSAPAAQADTKTQPDDASEDLELSDEDADDVAGGVDISPFNITKHTDKASP